MNLRALVLASLRYFAGAHVATALAAAAATGVLAGALMVGDSMRGSLRDSALARLGPIDYSLVGPRFLSEATVGRMNQRLEEVAAGTMVVPLIQLRGSARRAESSSRAGQVTILAVDDRFTRMWSPTVAAPTGRDVALSAALAEELGVAVGDDVVLDFGRPASISIETLFGRRDEAVAATRVTVSTILPGDGIGRFSLDTMADQPRTAVVALDLLQRALDRAGEVNTVLVAGPVRIPPTQPLPGAELHDLTADTVDAAFRDAVSLDDFGLRLAVIEVPGVDHSVVASGHGSYLLLESREFLLDSAVENAATAAATENNLRATGMLAYLATSIESVATGQRSEAPTTGAGEPAVNAPHRAAVPYSVVVALDTTGAFGGLDDDEGNPIAPPASGEAVLNRWTADALGVSTGGTIRLEYFVSGPMGALETRTVDLRVAGIVRMDYATTDRGFVPAYPGVTDARSLADWDPPFPVDMTRIQPTDEDYWNKYRTAPKVFIGLDQGRKLWSEHGERFGRLTGMRLSVGDGLDAAKAKKAFEKALLARIDPHRLGFRFDAVRAGALERSVGSTNFGVLFASFSFFLVAAGVLLVGLLFRLCVEQRAAQLGLVMAVGLPARLARRWIVGEGLIVATVGALVGSGGAIGYTWVMLEGLQRWWGGTVSVPDLRVHVSPLRLAIGVVVGSAASWLAMSIAARRMTALPPRSLLRGVAAANLESSASRRRETRVVWLLITTALTVGLSAWAWGAAGETRMSLFFAAGAACLATFLQLLGTMLRRGVQQRAAAPVISISRLAALNLGRRGGRGLTTAAMIAFAVFIVVAVGAFRLDLDPGASSRNGPTGGFAVLSESAVPLSFDLNTVAGRELGGVLEPDAADWASATVVPLRLRPGDDASCRSVYQVGDPRILGAPRSLIERGGFAFAGSMAATDAERSNPWLLLERRFDDGAIPAIADANTAQWQLKWSLGADRTITDDRGRSRSLRLVALLGQSVLQSEVVIAEQQFTDCFPRVDGHAFFLVDVPPGRGPEWVARLEQRLTRFGVDAITTESRLQGYFAVQNMYISIFQALGGLGLVLGVFGLTGIVLRQARERRSELALLAAVGLSRRATQRLLLYENAMVLVGGVLTGALSALVAVLPSLSSESGGLPGGSLIVTVGGMVAVGILAPMVGLRLVLRGSLVGALRAE